MLHEQIADLEDAIQQALDCQLHLSETLLDVIHELKRLETRRKVDRIFIFFHAGWLGAITGYLLAR